MNAIIKGPSNVYCKVSLCASITLIAFGVSDIIEASTGAWWRPLSLLFFKAGCVLTLLGSYICTLFSPLYQKLIVY
ncbi:hypothetical protein N480_00790 [Pseudoalteromonas luteoviolacea S2607]|nr:hypothetical protein N480_00790 [Pseudoalteromonas luteoviolacea S2607]